jgi:hypothetical protein
MWHLWVVFAPEADSVGYWEVSLISSRHTQMPLSITNSFTPSLVLFIGFRPQP